MPVDLRCTAGLLQKMITQVSSSPLKLLALYPVELICFWHFPQIIFSLDDPPLPNFRVRASVGNDYISESLSGRFTLATGCIARRTTCSVVLPNDAKEDSIILV